VALAWLSVEFVGFFSEAVAMDAVQNASALNPE
jgi:hypothetical protein